MFDTAQGPQRNVTTKDDMSGHTESVPVKVSIAMHARLKMVAQATGAPMQDFVRAAIERALEEKFQEWKVAARLLRGEEIASQSRGNDE